MLELRMHEAHLLRRQGMTITQVADELGCSQRTVYNYLNENPRSRRTRVYDSKLDPFKPHIDSLLSESPDYNRERLMQDLVRLGYSGKITILRDYAAKVAEKERIQAVIRFETLPGQQAQVDWKDAGRRTVSGERCRVYAFTMVLGYSRAPFVVHTTSMDQATVLACHVLAFNHFGVVPKELLYDNMKTAFIRDTEGRWKPNRHLLRLANHYGFIPRRCRVRRPQTKGKVERFIRTYGESFLKYLPDGLSLREMDFSVDLWIKELMEKKLRDFNQSRRKRLLEDKKAMIELPIRDFDVRREISLIVSRESLVSYRTNRFSVPAVYIGMQLTFRVNPLDGDGTLYHGAKVIRYIPHVKNRRETFWREEDRISIQKRWRRQIERRPSKPRVYIPVPPVDTRSPSEYDQIISRVASI